MQSTQEFQVGKHGIGYLYGESKIAGLEFQTRNLGCFRKLERAMSDSEIESELKPGSCELGDVIAFLDAAPQECKDGYANLFYLPQCVVYVYWNGSRWDVFAWDRDVSRWDAGRRVFSPASDRSDTHVTKSSDALTLESLGARVAKLESIINPDLLK